MATLDFENDPEGAAAALEAALSGGGGGSGGSSQPNAAPAKRKSGEAAAVKKDRRRQKVAGTNSTNAKSNAARANTVTVFVGERKVAPHKEARQRQAAAERLSVVLSDGPNVAPALGAPVPDIIRLIAKAGGTGGATDRTGRTMLSMALEADEMPLAQFLVDSVPHTDVDGASDAYTSARQRPPLLVALERGYVAFAKHLIAKKKASIGVSDKMGRGPLHMAAERGWARFAKFLLTSAGADPLVRDTAGNTPLMVAAARGDAVIAELLATHAAADRSAAVRLLARRDGGGTLSSSSAAAASASAGLVVLRNNAGQTALHMAAAGGHLGVVRLLVEGFKADVRVLDTGDQSAFYLALQRSLSVSPAPFKHLCASSSLSSPPPSGTDRRGATVVSSPVAPPQETSALAPHQPPIQVSNGEGCDVAERCGAVARYLLGRDASLMGLGGPQRHPLLMVLAAGDARWTGVALYGKPLSTLSALDDPVAGAAPSSAPSADAALESAGSGASVAFAKGGSASRAVAVNVKSAELTAEHAIARLLRLTASSSRTLSEKGAAEVITASDYRRCFISLQCALPPLHFAAITGDVSLFDALLSAKADLSLLDEDGASAIYRAVQFGQSAILDLVWSRAGVGAAAVGAGRGPLLPIVLAVTYGDADTAQELLRRGAPLDFVFGDEMCLPLSPAAVATCTAEEEGGGNRTSCATPLSVPSFFSIEGVNGQSLLHAACRIGSSPRTARLILDSARGGLHSMAASAAAGASLPSRGSKGSSADSVWALRDSFHRTPLMIAATHSPSIVALLLRAAAGGASGSGVGGGLMDRTKEGLTALHFAAAHGNADCCALLMKALLVVPTPPVAKKGSVAAASQPHASGALLDSLKDTRRHLTPLHAALLSAAPWGAPSGGADGAENESQRMAALLAVVVALVSPHSVASAADSPPPLSTQTQTAPDPTLASAAVIAAAATAAGITPLMLCADKGFAEVAAYLLSVAAAAAATCAGGAVGPRDSRGGGPSSLEMLLSATVRTDVTSPSAVLPPLCSCKFMCVHVSSCGGEWAVGGATALHAAVAAYAAARAARDDAVRLAEEEGEEAKGVRVATASVTGGARRGTTSAQRRGRACGVVRRFDSTPIVTAHAPALTRRMAVVKSLVGAFPHEYMYARGLVEEQQRGGGRGEGERAHVSSVAFREWIDSRTVRGDAAIDLLLLDSGVCTRGGGAASEDPLVSYMASL